MQASSKVITTDDFYRLTLLLNKFTLFLIAAVLPLVTGPLQILTWLFILICNAAFIVSHFYQEMDRDLNFRIKLSSFEVSMLIWGIWTLFLLVYFTSGVAEFVKTMAVITTTFSLSRTKWTSRDFFLLKSVAAAYILTWILYYPFAPASYFGYYAAYFDNPNLLGMFAFNSLLPFVILPGKPRIFDFLFGGLALVVIYLSGSRTIYLQTMIFLVCYYLFRYIWKHKHPVKSHRSRWTKDKFTFKFLFLLMVLFVFLFSLLYPLLGDTPVGAAIDEISRSLFNKNFFSGRNIIWQKVFIAVEGSPLIGRGLTAEMSDFFDMRLSAHSLYMQIILQTGILGLLVIVQMLIRLFEKLYQVRGYYSVSAIGLLISVVFRETFEISLTQNLLLTGIYLWVFFALGLNEPLNNKIKGEKYE